MDKATVDRETLRLLGRTVDGLSARDMERVVFDAMDAGNEQARWVLWMRYQGLVRKYADRFAPNGGSLREDLETAALGVFEVSMRSYDRTKARHATYAAWFSMSLSAKYQSMTGRAIPNGVETDETDEPFVDDDLLDELPVTFVSEIDRQIVSLMLRGWPLQGSKNEPGIRSAIGLSEADYARRLETILRKLVRAGILAGSDLDGVRVQFPGFVLDPAEPPSFYRAGDRALTAA